MLAWLPFRNGEDAGRLLAGTPGHLALGANPSVLALPHGGVPVDLEIAQALHDYLDVLLVCKLGAPGQGELAIGAIASGGVRILNDSSIRQSAHGTRISRKPVMKRFAVCWSAPLARLSYKENSHAL
jgi:putative phosphoribosyl transferase